jgi:hypothetical protein
MGNISKVDNIILEMINDKIKEYQSLISELESKKAQIVFSETANNRAVEISPQRSIDPEIFFPQKTVLHKSCFKRMVDVLDKLPESFTRYQIKEMAEQDGCGAIKDGTFSPSFSQLIKKNIVIQVEAGYAGKAAKYKKTPPELKSLI